MTDEPGAPAAVPAPEPDTTPAPVAPEPTTVQVGRNPDGTFATPPGEPPQEPMSTEAYAAYQAAGLTPEALGSPAELQQRMELANRLVDDHTRVGEMTRLLQSTGQLPQGVSLGDVLDIVPDLIAEEEEQAPAPDFSGEGQIDPAAMQAYIDSQIQTVAHQAFQQQSQAQLEAQRDAAISTGLQGMVDGGQLSNEAAQMAAMLSYQILDEADRTNTYVDPSQVPAQAVQRLQAMATSFQAPAAAQAAAAPQTPTPAVAPPPVPGGTADVTAGLSGMEAAAAKALAQIKARGGQ